MAPKAGDEIFVAFSDVYEQRDISSIHTSLEAAMAAHPGDWTEYHPGRWSRDNKGRPEGDYCEIARYEVSG